MHDNTGPFAQLVSETDRAELQRILDAGMDEAQLMRALGETLGAEAIGDDPEERGRAVFRRRLEEIRGVICGNEVLRSYWSNPNVSDATSIAVSVAGAFVASSFSGINVVLVAALVTRIGLRSICKLGT